LDEDDVDETHEHMWRLVGLALSVEEGSHLEYECELCGSPLLVAPGGVQPATA
jgi:hypothetical protein